MNADLDHREDGVKFSKPGLLLAEVQAMWQGWIHRHRDMRQRNAIVEGDAPTMNGARQTTRVPDLDAHYWEVDRDPMERRRCARIEGRPGDCDYAGIPGPADEQFDLDSRPGQQVRSDSPHERGDPGQRANRRDHQSRDVQRCYGVRGFHNLRRTTGV